MSFYGAIRRHNGPVALYVLVSSLAVLPIQETTASPAFDALLKSSDANLIMEWGKHHQYGVRVSQSIDRAIQLYCASARLGLAEAQVRLGEIYSIGLAGKRDDVLAAAWLLKAVADNSDQAIRMLARWDLAAAELPFEPECVTSDLMVTRTLPPARPLNQPAVAQPAPTPAKPKLAGPNPRRADIVAMVEQLAPTYRLDPELVLAVIEVESNFNPKARSHKHAQGLMQLIPETAKRFGVADPYDPDDNVRGGMAYLRWLLDHFDGDLTLALAGYNAGEGAVQRHGGVPPYKETRNYVRRVAQVLGIPEDRLGTHGDPKPAPRGTVWMNGREVTPDAPLSDWETRFFETGVSG
jgi:soluble lytic murein transglycosylase-like protein